MNTPAQPHAAVVVLDTNIVLDLWLFDDPTARLLRDALHRGVVHWLATASMREELARVLDYEHVAPQLKRRGLGAVDVLAAFDRHVRMYPAGPGADLLCKDPDDQKFVDLALAHGARLLSKDREVLSMAPRLARRGVTVRPVFG